MRVFISYSFHDEELYLLSLLINKFKEQGHNIDTSDYLFENNKYNINRTDLFVGLITNHSESINKVIEEWNIAKGVKKKSILLIEEGIQVSDKTINYIRFNRFHPEKAIQELLAKNQHQTVKKKNTDVEDILIFSGIVAGVAALISLLAGGNKK
jgi:hypothetical protein